MTVYPDEQVEVLAGLNAELRRIVDKAAAEKILHGTPDRETIKAWRLSANLTMPAMAEGLRCSTKTVLRIENGLYPVNEHFLQQLRPFVRLVADGALPHIPNNIIAYPLPPQGKVDRYVGLSKVVGYDKGEWRKCAYCQQKKFFPDKRKLYCTDKCKRTAEKEGRSVGVQNNRSNRADAPTQRKTRCEQCGHEQTIAGHLVNKPKGSQAKRK